MTNFLHSTILRGRHVAFILPPRTAFLVEHLLGNKSIHESMQLEYMCKCFEPLVEPSPANQYIPFATTPYIFYSNSISLLPMSDQSLRDPKLSECTLGPVLRIVVQRCQLNAVSWHCSLATLALELEVGIYDTPCAPLTVRYIPFQDSTTNEDLSIVVLSRSCARRVH